MRTRDKITLAIVAILMTLALMTLFWPAFGESIDREEIKLGLDLEGGAHLVYEADFDKLPEGQDAEEAFEGVINVIEKRVNAFGVSEPVIRKMGDNRLMVQIPGIDDIEEAKSLIGKTVLINFKEFKPYDPSSKSIAAAVINSETSTEPINEGTPAETVKSGTPALQVLDEDYHSGYFAMRMDEDGIQDLAEVTLDEIIEGENVWVAVPASAIIENENLELTSQHFSGGVGHYLDAVGNKIVTFDWNSTGEKLSEQITTRLLNEGYGTVENKLGIFLGDEYISAPQVKAVIKKSGEISGMSKGEASRLISLLNAGRIDVPLYTIEEHDVDPSLGDDFIDWSLQAGIIGLILVIMFLIAYYRLSGILAGVALLIYTALVMSVYQIWPITLTLSGIAGFILSIGMAVDANILIFERMKEEIRRGHTIRASVEIGFNRAWSAIRDSNISTLITCAILIIMGNYLAVPSVEGFAWTLAIGVAISMFSAIIITRTFLRFLGTTPLANQRSLFVSALKDKMLSGEGL